MTKHILLALVFVLGLAIMGCGDDDKDNGQDTTVADTMEVTEDTTPPQDTTPPEETTPPQDTTPPTGACMNESDGAILATEEGRGAVTSAAGTCGLGCMSDADPAGCSVTCVSTETGLSAGCSACYAGIIACSIDNCVPACLDPSAAACAECQEAEGCLAAFFACSGLE